MDLTPGKIERIWLNGWGRIAAKRNGWLRKRYAPCCTDLVVTLNGARDKRWRMFKKLSDYEYAFSHLRDMGIRVHVMTWIRPDVDGWIRPMVSGLELLREVTDFETVLLDAEGQWSRGFAGKRPLRRARREQIWSLAAGLAHHGLRDAGFTYGVTDVPMVDWGVVKDLCLRADYVMPQMHEFHRGKGIRRPGQLVKWTYAKWPQRLGWGDGDGPRLIPHLAFYGKQTRRSVYTSVEAALAHGATEIAGWTGRSLGGQTLSGRAIRKELAVYKQEIGS